MATIPQHLRPTVFQFHEFAFDRRSHQLPEGVTLEDVLSDPEYWAHTAAVLKVGTMIEVTSADFTTDVDLRVVAIDPYKRWARVVLRGKAAPAADDAQPAADADGYMIQNDPVQSWRIVRGKEVLAHHLPSEDAAKAKLAEFKRPMRRAS